MPETDELAARLIATLRREAPARSGCRLNHARGLLAVGRFIPSPDARGLSRADVLAGPDRPVLARFSSSTADEHVAQDDPHADPRGLAVTIGESPGMTLVGHSVEAFPASDPTEFLHFLGAVNAANDPARLASHGSLHAAARLFGDGLGRPAASFAELTYHMLHAYRLTSYDGRDTIGRISIVGPAGAPGHAAQRGDPDLLDGDLRRRLAREPVELEMMLQIAGDGDVVADMSAPWSGGGERTALGRLVIERIAADQEAQRSLAFDPSTLPDGIAFAGDPMIEARLAAYRIAASERIIGHAPTATTGQPIGEAAGLPGL